MITMARSVSFFALLTLGLSALWLIFLMISMAAAGPLNTFELVLAHVSNPSPLFWLSYYNAALITLSATALYAGLYRVAHQAAPTPATIGLVFVPAYCAMNLFAYLSQVTVVPALLPALQDPASAPAARLLLAQLIQEWPYSGVAILNGLAYALLGIPSILFGLVFASETGALRTGGILLVLNGAACIIGLIGSLAGFPPLAQGTLIGGVLFILAMPFLAAGLRV
jgi:hypothetical protein